MSFAACFDLKAGGGGISFSSRALAQEQASAEQQFKQTLLGAEKGDVRAMRETGLAYGNGKGVQRDYAQALVWLRKAADKGDVEAMTLVGSAYWFGRGVERDYAEALTWLRKAADKGDAVAMRQIAIAYRYGNGVAEDKEQYPVWLHKAADRHDKAAMFMLGEWYMGQYNLEGSEKKALYWYEQAATAGVPEAMGLAGVMYARNRADFPANIDKAISWLSKGAEKGEPFSMFHLGLIHLDESLGRVDAAKAFGLISQAAEKGSVPARYKTGLMYFLGHGTEKDAKESAIWLARFFMEKDSVREGAELELDEPVKTLATLPQNAKNEAARYFLEQLGRTATPADVSDRELIDLAREQWTSVLKRTLAQYPR